MEFSCLISPPTAGYWIFHQSDEIDKYGVDIYDRLVKYKITLSTTDDRKVVCYSVGLIPNKVGQLTSQREIYLLDFKPTSRYLPPLTKIIHIKKRGAVFLPDKLRSLFAVADSS